MKEYKKDTRIRKLEYYGGWSIIIISLLLGGKIGWVGINYEVKLSFFGLLVGLIFMHLAKEEEK